MMNRKIGYNQLLLIKTVKEVYNNEYELYCKFNKINEEEHHDSSEIQKLKDEIHIYQK